MSMTRICRRRLTLAASLAVLAGVLFGCAPAGAFNFQPFYEYTVAFIGQGSYTRSSTDEGPGKLTEEASWKWNTVYAHVLIPTTASSPLESAGFPAIGPGQDASGDWKITNTGSEGEDCSNSGTLSLPKDAIGGGGGGSLTVKRPTGGTKGVIFNATALNEYESSPHGDNVLPCDPSNWWQDTILGFIGVGSRHASAGLPDVKPLTAKVQLAPSDLKHASVTKHVSIGPAEEVSGDCGSGDGSVCTDTYTWSGTVKFTKHKFKV
jgi:hypothetical protein